MLNTAREKEQKRKKPATNRKRGRPRKRLIKKVEKKNKAENTTSSAINSNIKKEKYIIYKLRSRKKK